MSLKTPLEMIFRRKFSWKETQISNFDLEAITGFSPCQKQTVQAVMGLIFLLPFLTMASIMFASSTFLHYNLQWMNVTVNAYYSINTLHPPKYILSNVLCPIAVLFWMIPVIRAMKLRGLLKELLIVLFVGVMYSGVLNWSTLLITLRFHHQFVHGNEMPIPQGRDGQVLALNSMDCHVSLLIRNLSEPGFEKQIRVQPESIFGLDVTEGNTYEFQGFASSCPQFKRLGNKIYGWSNILHDRIDQHQVSTIMMIPDDVDTLKIMLLPQYSLDLTLKGLSLTLIIILPPGNSIPSGIIKQSWNKEVVANFSTDLKKYGELALGHVDVYSNAGRFDIFVDGFLLKTTHFYAGGSYELLVRYVGVTENQNASKYSVSIFQSRPANQHDVTFYIVAVLLLSLYQSLLVFLLQEFAVCEVPRELRCLSLAVVPWIPLTLPIIVNEYIKHKFLTVNPSTSEYWKLCLAESGIFLLGMMCICFMRKRYIYYGIRIQADKYSKVAPA